MHLKRTIPLIALFALAAVFAAVAPAARSSHASLVIRHQVRGCHAWSLNGGTYKTSQTLALTRGGSLTVTNNDVMPHKLIETSGPAVSYTRLAGRMSGMMGLKGNLPPAMLGRMAASTKITFARAGVYHFTTKPGDDYMAGIKTVGPDNVLHLVVRVG